MPFLGGLAADQSGRARLYAFEADPPTVTMQRLKALTTGSLPTFVDVGRNFAGGAITEDNILSQAAAADLRSVFVGDDTWTGLFPASFADARPFPSFNVQDLHTVDNGVIGTLVPGLGLEAGAGTNPRLRGAPRALAVDLSNSSQTPPTTGKRATLLAGSNSSDGLPGWLRADANSWDIAIAHMLGVDHVGHRVGPYHPAMGLKLEQTDRVLEAVWNSLPSDTLLVVFGDHGMTSGGNHGGASPAETHAALVVAAKSGLFDETPVIGNATRAAPRRQGGSRAPEDGDWFRSPHRCRQVDLVPTLSFLLGLPVPAASMGVLVPGLHYAGAGELGDGGVSATQVAAETRRLLQNAEQVSRYIEAYALAAPSFMDAPMRAGLSALLATQAQARASLQLAHGVVASNSALRASLAEVTGLCRKRWTQFDELAMGRGALLVGAGAGLSLRVWAGTPPVQARWLLGAALAGFVCSWGWKAASGVVLRPDEGSAEWWISRESFDQVRQWVRGAVGDGPSAVDGVSLENVARLTAWLISAALDSPAAAAAVAASACWMLAGRAIPGFGNAGDASANGSEFGGWAVQAAIAARCATLWSNSYLDHEEAIVGSLGTAVVLALLVQRWKEGKPMQHFFALAAATIVLGYGASQSRTLHSSPQVPNLVVASGCLAGAGVMAALGLVVAGRLGTVTTMADRAFSVGAGSLTGGSVVATLLYGALEHAVAESQVPGPASPHWGDAFNASVCARWALGLGWASVALWLGRLLFQCRGIRKVVASAGLGTRASSAQSSALLALVAAVLSLCPAAGILGGLAGFASVSLAAFHCMAIVALASWGRWGGSLLPGSPDEALRVGWGALALYLAAWTHFFGTGHSASFASLRFSAAFVGFDDVDFLRGGMAVAVDTLAGPLMASFGLVVLAFAYCWPARGGSEAGTARATGRASVLPPLDPPTAAVRLAAAWQFMWLAALLSSAVFVLFARRHLMVWAVFAPKLCFDAGCSAVALVFGLLVAVCCRDSCKWR